MMPDDELRESVSREYRRRYLGQNYWSLLATGLRVLGFEARVLFSFKDYHMHTLALSTAITWGKEYIRSATDGTIGWYESAPLLPVPGLLVLAMTTVLTAKTPMVWATDHFLGRK